MRALKLRIISAQQTIQTIVINNKLSLAVEQGASYAVIDAETNELVKDLVLKKQADLLVVESANEVIIELKQFYNDAFQSTFDVGVIAEDGNPNSISSDSPVAEDSNIVWQPNDASIENDTFTTSDWVYTGLGSLLGVAVAAGVAAGVSGGGNSSEAEIVTETGTNNIVQGGIVAGPVLDSNELTVLVYQADGRTLLGEASVTANGKFSIDVGDYTGVVIAKVKDNSSGVDYLDEATGLEKDLNAELFSMGVIAVPNSITDLNINALTTIAYQKAKEQAGSGPLDAGIVINTNTAIAEAFGLENLQTTRIVTTNGGQGYNEVDGLSEAETYGAVLAAFSGADKNNDGDSQSVIDKVAAGITVTGTSAILSVLAQQEIISGATNVNVDVQAILDTTELKITSSAIATAIDENSGAGQVIYRTTVLSDSDVSYSLKESTGNSDLFSINSNTGEVTLIANADYEAKASYSFTVVVTDAENNFQERAISLAINNVDESAPVPISGSSEIDTSVVVFDLLRGVSSNHSEREFDSSASYEIYIQVDSGRAELNIPREESANWGVWHGWDKLSSDDHIIFVGSNGIILGEENLPIVRYAQFDNTYYLQSATFTAIAFNVNGNITRVVDDNRSSAILGENTLVTHSVNQLPVVNLTQAFTQRPDEIWSTQGLL